MGFNRDNYVRIKQEYEGKYLLAQAEANTRRSEVHAKIPEVAQIDKQLGIIGLELFGASLSQDQKEIDAVNEKNQRLQSRRAELLTAHGFAPDYTGVKYECEACSDTGVVDFRMCRCMKKRLVEAGVESSGMSELIKRQSFDNFNLDYYRQTPETYSRMSAIYAAVKKYAEDFNAETSQSMAMFGGTGLGKTHLSSAMARVIIENGNDVYYTCAMNMFADFEQKKFGSSAGFDSTGDVSQYYNCDLLIIDDVGTEMANQFTVSCLYNVINTRLNRKKPTVISTNLTREEFRKRYWDRIASRVFGEFLVLPFLGKDIREQKLNR